MKHSLRNPALVAGGVTPIWAWRPPVFHRGSLVDRQQKLGLLVASGGSVAFLA